MSFAPSGGSTPPGDRESIMTLEPFVIDRHDQFPQDTGAFSRVLRDASVAVKIINHNIRRVGILDVMGEPGTVNVQ